MDQQTSKWKPSLILIAFNILDETVLASMYTLFTET